MLLDFVLIFCHQLSPFLFLPCLVFIFKVQDTVFGQCEVEQAGGSSLIQRQQHSAGLKLGQKALTVSTLKACSAVSSQHILSPGRARPRLGGLQGRGVWTGKGDGQGEQGRPRTDPSHSPEGSQEHPQKCGPQERDTGRWQPVTLLASPSRRMLHKHLLHREGSGMKQLQGCSHRKAEPSPSSRFPVCWPSGWQMTPTPSGGTKTLAWL